MATKSNGDAWSNLATKWKTQVADGLQLSGIQSAKALVVEVNRLAPFSKAESIHDLGCGNGIVIDELFKAYGSDLPESAQLLASDKSVSMVSEVTERLGEMTKEGNKEWSKLTIKAIDACDMKEIDDDSFTHVLAGNMLYAVSDYEKALSEVKRTLRPGGIFGYSVNAVAPWVSLMSFVTQVRPDKVTPYPPAIWHTAESCMKVLEDAGFSDVNSHTITVAVHYDSHEGAVDTLMEVLPFMGRILEGMTEQEIQKSKELMIEHLKKESPSKVMEGKGVITTGRK